VSRFSIHRVARAVVPLMYPFLYKGLNRCLRGTGRTHEEVIESLLGTEEGLYMLMIDRSWFVGFFTLHTYRFQRETWGTVGLLFVDSDKLQELKVYSRQVFREGQAWLEEMLRKRGCTHMNYITDRAGFRRLSPRLGFRSRLVEWVKEVS
jgi:hypothetical protein